MPRTNCSRNVLRKDRRSTRREAGQLFAQTFEWQANDIAEGTGNGSHDIIAMFLDGVGAGFVQWIDFRMITRNFLGTEGAESDLRAVSENALPMSAKMDQTNAGHDFVGAALQFFQHALRIRPAGWFAIKLCAVCDQRIHSDDEGVGKFFGNGTGFSVRIDLGKFTRCEMLVVNFVRSTWDGLKFQASLAQKFQPSRRR